MKKRRPADMSKSLVKVLKDWQKLEDESISHADATIRKTRNKLVTVSYTHLTLPTICSV